MAMRGDGGEMSPAALRSIQDGETYTVATLPANAVKGQRAAVTDATGPSFGATVVTGGVVFSPVYYDGSAWKVG